MTIIIKTHRLALRHQVIEDLDGLWALCCSYNGTKYIPKAPRSRAEALQGLKSHVHGHSPAPCFGASMTVHQGIGKFIDTCGLLPWAIEGHYDVEIARMIAAKYGRQALGSEAMQAILQYGLEISNLPRLIFLIDPDISAPQRVTNKIGILGRKQLTAGNEMIFRFASIRSRETNTP